MADVPVCRVRKGPEQALGWIIAQQPYSLSPKPSLRGNELLLPGMAGFLASDAHRERASCAKSPPLASGSVTSVLKVLIAFEQETSHYHFAVGPRVTQLFSPHWAQP